MNKKRICSSILTGLTIIFASAYSYAWNDTVTHRTLSKFATQDSILYGSTYFGDIGIAKGLNVVPFGTDPVYSAIPLTE